MLIMATRHSVGASCAAALVAGRPGAPTRPAAPAPSHAATAPGLLRQLRRRGGRAGVTAPVPVRRLAARRPAALASDDAEDDGGGEEAADVAAARARLVASASASADQTTITGRELRVAVFDKWGRDYAVMLARRGRRVFFQVLWKHLEQASYPQSPEDHAATYDAVAHYLSEWGAGGTVRAGIAAAPRRGPGYTGGGAARAVSIPLDVDLSTARGGEFF
jgi:hypothetical protein